MAEREMQALSRLRNPRTETREIKGVDTGEEHEEGEGGPHEALEAMHEHEPESKHAIVSHDGYGMTTHTIDEDGKHDGPHNHENIEELKQHLGKFFNEEEHEGDEDKEDDLEDSGNLY